MLEFEFKEKYGIEDLLKIIKILRSENGCPWDKVQTHESIRSDLIEEAYEVCEGIDCNSPEMLREELGDLLLQVAFHTEIEMEQEHFDFNDVCNDICQKLVFRHPHVFGSVKADTEDEVLKNWDALKKESKNQDTYTETLESVPKTFPALMRGEKVCRRAARARALTDDVHECIERIRNGLNELEDASSGDIAHNQHIIGNVLMNFCNLDRILKIDSEKALTYSTNRFIMVFKALENDFTEKGISLDKLSDDEIHRFAEKVISGF